MQNLRYVTWAYLRNWTGGEAPSLLLLTIGDYTAIYDRM